MSYDDYFKYHEPNPPRRGIFQPKNLETLRPEARDWIGKTFDWHCEGTSNSDEPYPEQKRWVRVGQSRWCPDEDIEWLNPY